MKRSTPTLSTLSTLSTSADAPLLRSPYLETLRLAARSARYRVEALEEREATRRSAIDVLRAGLDVDLGKPALVDYHRGGGPLLSLRRVGCFPGLRLRIAERGLRAIAGELVMARRAAEELEARERGLERLAEAGAGPSPRPSPFPSPVSPPIAPPPPFNPNPFARPAFDPVPGGTTTGRWVGASHVPKWYGPDEAKAWATGALVGFGNRVELEPPPVVRSARRAMADALGEARRACAPGARSDRAQDAISRIVSAVRALDSELTRWAHTVSSSRRRDASSSSVVAEALRVELEDVRAELSAAQARLREISPKTSPRPIKPLSATARRLRKNRLAREAARNRRDERRAAARAAERKPR